MTVQFSNFVASESGEHLSFEASGMSAQFAVTARKLILADVETVAVSYDPYSDDPAQQDIEVQHNTGCLHNEWLSHRLSLIPIHFDERDTDEFDPDRFQFLLDVENNKGKSNRDVTTGDIQVFVDGTRDVKAEARLFPPDLVTGDHVLITRLRWLGDASYHEGVRVKFRARKSCGRQHARWCPVSQITFRNVEAERLRFDIESCCGLRPATVFHRALLKLHQRLGSLVGDASFETDDDGVMTVVNVPGEYHVVMPFVQDGLNQMTDDFKFAGYVRPHPLVNNVQLKIIANADDARSRFAAAVSKIADQVAGVTESFVGASGLRR